MSFISERSKQEKAVNLRVNIWSDSQLQSQALCRESKDYIFLHRGWQVVRSSANWTQYTLDKLHFPSGLGMLWALPQRWWESELKWRHVGWSASTVAILTSFKRWYKSFLKAAMINIFILTMFPSNFQLIGLVLFPTTRFGDKMSMLCLQPFPMPPTDQNKISWCRFDNLLIRKNCLSLLPSLPAALGFSPLGDGTSAAASPERCSVSANPRWPLRRLLPRHSPARQPWRGFRALPLDSDRTERQKTQVYSALHACMVCLIWVCCEVLATM